jgi:hypothetical protein
MLPFSHFWDCSFVFTTQLLKIKNLLETIIIIIIRLNRVYGQSLDFHFALYNVAAICEFILHTTWFPRNNHFAQAT